MGKNKKRSIVEWCSFFDGRVIYLKNFSGRYNLREKITNKMVFTRKIIG